MAIKKVISKDRIQECLEGNRWNFGNMILYAMCKNYPLHESIDEIVGKVWLIGRTYSAAIERRKNTGITEFGDDFYFNVVAPKMLTIGKELDSKIKNIKRYPCITEDNLWEIVETHSFLTNVFYDISGQKQRSLASKYLHFHAPQMFYIFDDRARREAIKFVKHSKQLRLQLEQYGDKDYIEHVSRLYELDKYIHYQFNQKVTPRVIDSLLLDY